MEKYLLKHIKDIQGEQFIFKFENGYGVSVIRSSYSYGGGNGLFEAMPILFEGEEYSISYVLGEPKGWLYWEDVVKILLDVKELE